MYSPHIQYEMAKLHHKDLLDEARREKLIKDSGGSSGVHPALMVGAVLVLVIVLGLVDPVILLPQDSDVWLGDFDKILGSSGVII